MDPVALIASLIVAATPLVLAATGELIAEKSGVLNLGVEGMMIIGAICGFIGAVTTGSPVFGFISGALGGALVSMTFGVLTQVFLSNQVATGLALTLFGLGLSALLGQQYTGLRPPSTDQLFPTVLSDLPVIGRIVFSHDWMVYTALLLTGAVWWFLNKSRGGLILRAVGESHVAAHALGYPVVLIRLAAIAFGGALAGLGGAYLSLVRVPQWNEGMTAGIGWIALAIVVFASWKPGRVILGAWLFGGVTILQLNLQAMGVNIPTAYLSMTPYLMTIIVLVIMSSDRNRAALNAPASLGRVFHASG
ncbi:MAG: ABC transporter permease [Pseudomonadota bacterium]